jgi:hypothetical protein
VRKKACPSWNKTSLSAAVCTPKKSEVKFFVLPHPQAPPVHVQDKKKLLARIRINY